MQQPPSDDAGELLSPAFLLEFYKALADPVRLRIAGVLAGREATASELAKELDVPAPAVARHLQRLEAATIVSRRDGGRYALDREGLQRRAEVALMSPRSRELAGATDDRSRVLATFFREGKLIGWPTGDQRKLIILAELARRFETSRTYSEREVNEQLKAVYADYSTLRRALVDYRFMNRHKGVYWLGEGRLSEPPP